MILSCYVQLTGFIVRIIMLVVVYMTPKDYITIVSIILAYFFFFSSPFSLGDGDVRLCFSGNACGGHPSTLQGVRVIF